MAKSPVFRKRQIGFTEKHRQNFSCFVSLLPLKMETLQAVCLLVFVVIESLMIWRISSSPTCANLEAICNNARFSWVIANTALSECGVVTEMKITWSILNNGRARILIENSDRTLITYNTGSVGCYYEYLHRIAFGADLVISVTALVRYRSRTPMPTQSFYI